MSYIKNRRSFYLLFLCFISVAYGDNLYAQCSPGAITVTHQSKGFDALLDPDGDGYITESGSTFTSGTTEAAEFEIIPNSTSGWVEVQDVNESDSDITPSCGNPDLVQDDDGGDFAYYNIVDPSPASPTSGDEYIVFRFRLSQSPNGNFGYNFLVDTDNAYGSTQDANTTCGNMGFEREVQFANAGGKKGVSVYDIDGNADINSALCSQCVSVNDVQEACAASSGACATSDPQFITFPVPLSYLGIGSDVLASDLFISAATASSGNATSVLGGGNVKDMGSLDNSNTGCGCEGLSGCALFDCQTDCINDARITALPIELASFEVEAKSSHVNLKWTTTLERENSHFEIQHSTNGTHFNTFGYVTGANNSNEINNYFYKHIEPIPGYNYYRLKQVDNDGSFEFSEIEVSYFEPLGEQRFSIVPTIASSQIHVILDNNNFDVKSQIEIFNAMGQIVWSTQMDASTPSLYIDITDYELGYYFIRFTNGNFLRTERFLKAL